MKISIPKSSLLEALTVTGKCIPSQSVVPILSCYKFDIAHDKLDVTGGDMAVFVTQTVEIIGGAFDLSVGIPKNILLVWIKELHDQPIEISFEKKQSKGGVSYTALLVSGDAKCKIPCENGNDYPKASTSNEEQTFEISSKDLHNGIDKSMFSCSTDPLKPDFSGLNLMVDNDGLTFNGCDGSNLATKTIALESQKAPALNIIVPTNTMALVRSLPCDEKIIVTVGDSSIYFQLSDMTALRSALISEEYKPVRSIIPVDHDKIAVMDAKSLLGALKRTVPFAESYSPVLSFSFGNGQVTINATNSFGGEAANETIKVDYTGDPIDLRLHGPWMIKFISRIEGENAKLTMAAEHLAVVISEDNVDIAVKRDLMLTMPIAG